MICMGRFLASIGHKGAKVMGKHLMDMYGLGLLSIDTDGIEFIICLLFVLSGVYRNIYIGTVSGTSVIFSCR